MENTKPVRFGEDAVPPEDTLRDCLDAMELVCVLALADDRLLDCVGQMWSGPFCAFAARDCVKRDIERLIGEGRYRAAARFLEKYCPSGGGAGPPGPPDP